MQLYVVKEDERLVWVAADDLAQWRADPNPLDPVDVLSIAAGYNR